MTVHLPLFQGMMKTLLTTLAILIACTTVDAGNVKALFSFARFADPTGAGYLETYLNVNGSSMATRQDVDGTLLGELEVKIRIGKGGALVYEDNYRVVSPIAGEDGSIPDFVDVQRIPLKNGNYTLTLSVSDVYDPSGEPATITQDLLMKQFKAKTTLSDLQILTGFVKSEEPSVLSKVGFDLIPYSSDFFPPQMSQLAFYVEAYNLKAKKGSDTYLIDTYITDAETELVVGDFRKYFMKKAGDEVIPVLHSFPIRSLPSGTYTLVAEIRDKDNEQLGRSTFTFIRSNAVKVDEAALTTAEQGSLAGTFVSSLGNKKKLEQYIRCHYPISKVSEVKTIEKKINYNDLEMMQRFLYDFWTKRDPINGEQKWEAYRKEIDRVDMEYHTNISHGCNTDRGRVFLQYGAPNTIAQQYNEPSSYPYEIWHYYEVKDDRNPQQSNVKFVFARMDGGMEDFQLLHSTAVGEMRNERWNLLLHKRSQTSGDIDQNNTFDHHGGRSNDLFRNPH